MTAEEKRDRRAARYEFSELCVRIAKRQALTFGFTRETLIKFSLSTGNIE